MHLTLTCQCLLIVFWVTLASSEGRQSFACHEGPKFVNNYLEENFHTETVRNELIITFNHYYRPKAREQYLRAALKKYNITTKWTIIPRNNEASAHPSDFELVRVSGTGNNHTERRLLEKHPCIKRVTYQQKVQRILKYIPNQAEVNNVTTSDPDDFEYVNVGGSRRRLLRAISKQVTSSLQANALWARGITGKGVKVAVFDTGLSKNHPHFRRIKERTNWTSEKSLDDGVSHGTFVAGVIASSEECLGFAPDVELHIYRIFTNNQISYTSWFLDAFNYAIFKRIHILNLSIGGPDFLDYPFVEKVLELSANKVIMVSAVGNDGPLYGTMNNPADQSDVIGVGGINFDKKIAKFSSRGMTTWELPLGYGRLKPDIVTYGSNVHGSNVHKGCRFLSGTSVASPVVTGAISLITSGALHKLDLVNPSSMKQILMEGSQRLPDFNMFEQGHGMLNLLESMKHMLSYTPRVTLSPAYLDFSESYMWPYSSQAMFCTGMPVIVNVTILNGLSVVGKIVSRPKWFTYPGSFGEYLNVSVTHSPILWPWSGWMAVHMTVNARGCEFEGEARGHLSLVVENPSPFNKSHFIHSTVYFPIKVKVIPKPPRYKRILWDQFHSLKYPPGYIPHDILNIKTDPLDWRADHIHTNFRDMYTHLRNSGYYIEVLREPYTCFNASDYGTLLLVDPEDEFFDEEISQLEANVYDHGMGLIVYADWYNTTVMKKIKFFDENTRQWWLPDTGGTNVPAVNDLLQPFGVSLSDFVAEGYFQFGDHSMHYASGSTIHKFPVNDGNIVIGAQLSDQGSQIITNTSEAMANATATNKQKHYVPILGLVQTKKAYRQHYADSLSGAIASSSFENISNDAFEDENRGVNNKNVPILNKRILLHKLPGAVNIEEKELPEAKLRKGQNKKKAHFNHPHVDVDEGRIAIYGDSSCLDSTHLQKACYWLLEALLEYTMIGHKSSLLLNHNKIKDFKLSEHDKKPSSPLPLRLANNNLRKYSRVLLPNEKFKKRKVSECQHLHWLPAEVVDAKDVKVLSDMMRDESIQQFQMYNHQGSWTDATPLMGLLDSPGNAENTKGYKSEERERLSYFNEKVSLLVVVPTFVVLALFIKFTVKFYSDICRAAKSSLSL